MDRSHFWYVTGVLLGLRHMGKKHKLTNSIPVNSLANFLGVAARFLAGVISIPLIIHAIGMEMYGGWVVLFAFVEVCQIGDFGISITNVVFLSKSLHCGEKKSAVEILSISSSITAIAATLIFIVMLLLTPLSMRLLEDLPASTGHLASAWLYCSLTGPIMILSRFCDSLFESREQYRLIGVLTGFTSVIGYGSVVVTAYLTHDLAMMALSNLVAHISLFVFRTLLAWRYVLADLELRFCWNGDRFREMIHHSGHTFISFLASVLFTSVDKLVVAYFLGVLNAGLYNMVTQVCKLITTFTSAMVRPMVPRIRMSHEEPASQRMPSLPAEERLALLKKTMWINAASCSLFATIIIVFSPLIHLFDNSIAVASSDFQIMAIIYATYSLNVTGYFYLLAVSQSRTVALTSMLSAILTLLLIGLGAATIGLHGAFLGNAGFCATLFMNIQAWKKEGESSWGWLQISTVPMTVLAGLWLTAIGVHWII